MTNDAMVRKTQVPKAQNLGTIYTWTGDFMSQKWRIYGLSDNC